MDGKTMRFAVYGFFLKRKFSFNNFTFTPVETELKFWNVVKKSKDSQYYNLMCYIETPELDAKKFIFEMETVLTFVQQQDVHIKQIFSDEVVASYDSFFDRGSNGAPYAMYPDLQEEIIKKLYCKLIDNKEPCNQIKNGSVFNSEYNAEFRSLVYKVIEPFHMKKKFLEVTYYLYFSGLEAFCKRYLKSYYPTIRISRNTSVNFAQMLEKLEINYIQLDTADMKFNLRKKDIDKEYFLRLSLSTYSNLRNSLFHENLFVSETESSKNRSKEKVKISDYDFYLSRLCTVVILKYIGVEHKYLDCSKWYMRIPLIGD